MATNELAEQLFEAVSLIASKQISNLPYDQTKICTIIDISNSDRGEYTVTDGMATWIAYSDEKYRKNEKVYITIPNNDMLNKTYISGRYIESDTITYKSYISPLNDFVDITGFLTNQLNTDEVSLLANNPSQGYVSIFNSGDINIKDCVSLGLQAEFKAEFNSFLPSMGEYGLGINIKYKKNNLDDTYFVTYRFPCSEMFGNPYLFNSYYLQEKLFDITDMKIITNINIIFYQLNNFYQADGTLIPYQNNNINFSNNLFVKNVGIKLGLSLKQYTEETVDLITNDDYKYNMDKNPKDRLMRVRWIRPVDGKMIVLDEDSDKDIDDSLSYNDEINFKIHWYHYRLNSSLQNINTNDFWEEIPTSINKWEMSIIPDNFVQQDKYKVIIESPIKSNIQEELNKLGESNDTTFNNLFAATEKFFTATEFEIFAKKVKNYILEAEGHTDFYTDYCLDETKRELYKNTDIASLRDYIDEKKNSVKYYESNILTFENEIDATLANINLIQGLNISIDSDNYNGIYHLYDDTNNIINIAESKKLRTLKAQYTSINSFTNVLNQVEEIMWCFPKNNTMIKLPEEGYEYSTDNGDIVFEINNLTNDTSISERQEELAADLENTDPNWQDIINSLTATQIQEQFNIERKRISNPSASQIEELKRRYNLLLEYKSNEEYYNYMTKFLLNTPLVVIKRNSVIATQNFRIKSYYTEKAINNTIICLIKKDGKIYTAEAPLYFSSLGNSGTKATFFIRLCNDEGREINALPYGGSAKIKSYLFDYNNNPVNLTENVFTYSWFNPPQNDVIDIDNNILSWKTENVNIEDAADAILQANVNYDGIVLTAYLPIPISNDDKISYIAGCDRIIYDSSGANPSYYKNPYQAFDANDEEIENLTWGLNNINRYYPSLNTNNSISPTILYFNDINVVSVICKSESNDIIKWIQPILIYQNKYGSAMLNNWDGGLVIDDSGNQILSAMIGAGIKNSNNTFSGILMGDVSVANNKSGIGLYGFYQGKQAFGLNADGTAFFGEPGKGRIQFDGNKGIIESYNYNSSDAGLQIDLDDAVIKAYGKSGSIKFDVNNNDDGNETLFEIKGKVQDIDTTKTLMNISSSGFYLQSFNYGVGLSGAKFDLQNGKFDIYGNAGNVSIDGSSDNDELFKICDDENKVLMNVSKGNYYLQSANYLVGDNGINTQGFNLNLIDGTIFTASLNLKAGTPNDGMIQLNTNGNPYFNITNNNVSLINIKKDIFELKSQKWDEDEDNSNIGMHFVLSSSTAQDDKRLQIEQNGNIDDDLHTKLILSEFTTDDVSIPNSGYIEGIGKYYIDGEDELQDAKFILDWRSSGLPININDKFKAYWNGRVDMEDLHAYKGRIGGWYINNSGIYSFDPTNINLTDIAGLALVKNGLSRPGDNSDEITLDTAEEQTSAIVVNNSNLRIAVGSFGRRTVNGNIDQDEIEENINENIPEDIELQSNVQYVGATTGFAVYNNGLMRAYGAILDGARIENGLITNATITNFTSDTIKRLKKKLGLGKLAYKNSI